MSTPCSYLLCGTPRTGSTLLCSLLSSTGVAGVPESYFREPDRQLWAARLGLSGPEPGRVDDTEFVAAVMRSGSTGNGVFAARLMWGSMPRLVEALGPGPRALGDAAVLRAALGPLRFVHLRRGDVVGQAVSWARAEQSGYWQHGDPVRAGARLHLDLALIDTRVALILEHDEAWRAWFTAESVAPLEVTYEALVSDPDRTVRRILDFIGVEPPDDWTPASPHRRQADAVNAEWVRRYRAATSGGPEPRAPGV